MRKVNPKVQEARARADKKVQNFEDRRLTILREAAKCFVEDGVRGTQLQAIADKFGMTRAALYHYVSSKEEIIEECFEWGYKALTELFDSAAHVEGSGLDKVRFLFTGGVKIGTTDFGRAVATLRFHDLDPALRTKFGKMNQFVYSRYEHFIGEGVKDGSIKPCNPRSLSIFIGGAVRTVSEWLYHDRSLDQAALEADFMTYLTGGIEQAEAKSKGKPKSA